MTTHRSARVGKRMQTLNPEHTSSDVTAPRTRAATTSIGRQTSQKSRVIAHRGRRTSSSATSKAMTSKVSSYAGANARRAAPRRTRTRARGLERERADQEKPNRKVMRVAYQGVPGAYSEGAALAAYPEATTVPKDQFDDVYAATENHDVDRAVLPFENSLGGSIHRNYDLILSHNLHVVGEVYYRVNHCLLAMPGQKMEDLRRAQSHPQALAQCEGYLSHRGMVREAVDDTAGAAKSIANAKTMGVAAVASRRAAELYGLQVYDEGIQDDASNVTRFLALSREPIPPVSAVDKPYKTSIACSLKEGPGALFRALACFSLRDINMTKIESRPLRTNPVTSSGAKQSMQFTYLFYIDIEANMADENTQNALRHLNESATFLRVLGSYPRDCSQL